ncbi:MAG: CHC2 zinc finger domain-containing protein [Pseudomonadota bacterium]
MTARDRDFEDWVAEARAVSVVDEIDRRGIRLKRSGNEMVGPCPACGGTDRFSVHPRRNVWCCRKAGRGGDAIALVQYLDGADFLAACETLTGEPPPRGEGTRASPEELAAREEARRAREAEREAASADFREQERKRLYEVWKPAVRMASPIAAYYGGRGIHLPPAFCARFLPEAGYFHGEVEDERGRKRPRRIHRGPAKLLPITDAEGTFQGLHFTFLALDGRGGWRKAEIADPDTGELLPAKKVRGSKRGNRILLVPARRAPTRQVAGEGPETVLSVYTADLLLHRLREDTEYVSSVDLGNLAGKAADGCRLRHPTQTRTDKLGRVCPTFVPGPEPDFSSPAMWVSEAITHLTLLGDGDSDPFTTRAALERAERRHAAPGRHVSTAWPPDGMDFNDLLMRADSAGRAA